MSLSQWFFHNPDSLFSILITVIGFILYGYSQILCSYRTKRWIRFFWFDLFNKKEKKIAIIGMVMAIIGFASWILIPMLFGYYYYDGNAHQWIFIK